MKLIQFNGQYLNVDHVVKVWPSDNKSNEPEKDESMINIQISTGEILTMTFAAGYYPAAVNRDMSLAQLHGNLQGE